ncbi:MAG TPA: alpha/beta fold hydrolase [Acidimicrobiia bacterium]
MSGTAGPEHFASFDGRSIAYAVFGRGPDVLLLHGFASDRVGNWVRPGIVDALVATGRRVIAYDARGHGASDKPHEVDAYEHDAMVRDAQALLDLLAVGAVDVVGYSMGSIVASRLVAHEPRARSLVLGGVGGRLARGRTPEARARTAAALEARGRARGQRPVDRAFRRFAERNANDLEALGAVQRAASAGTPGDVRSIRVPTLVVAGADDRLAGSPHELAALIPGAEAVVVPGNHLTAVGPRLAAAITEFLAHVSPT